MGNQGFACVSDEDGNNLMQNKDFIEVKKKAQENKNIYNQTCRKRAKNLLDWNKYQESLKEYKKVFERHNKEGKKLLEKGDYKQALENYKKAIEIYKEISEKLGKDKDVWVDEEYKNAVEIYSQMGEFISCNEDYQEALNLQRKFAPVKECGLIKDKKEAKECCKKHIDEYIGNGDKYMEEGNFDDAFKCYTDAIEICYDVQKALDNEQGENIEKAEINDIVAETWQKMGEHEKALHAYEKAIEFYPKYAKAWLKMGEILSRSGRHEDALDAYKKAEKHANCESDSLRAELLYEIVDTLSYFGNDKEALKKCGEAKELLKKIYDNDKNKNKNDNKKIPNNKDDDLKNLYYTLLKIKKWKDVQKYCTEKENKVKKRLKFYQEVGNTFFGFRNYEKALDEYEKAIGVYKTLKNTEKDENRLKYIKLQSKKSDSLSKLINCEKDDFLRESEKYEKALDAYTEAAEYCKKSINNDEIELKKIWAQILRKKGDTFSNWRDYNRSIRYKEIYEVSEITQKYFRIHEKIKYLYEKIKNTDRKASKVYEKAMEIFYRILKNCFAFNRPIEEFCRVHERADDLYEKAEKADREAIVAYMEALGIYKEILNDENKNTVLEKLKLEIYLEMDQIYEALKHTEEAKRNEALEHTEEAKNFYKKTMLSDMECIENINVNELQERVLEYFKSDGKTQNKTNEEEQNIFEEIQDNVKKLYIYGKAFYTLKKYEEAKKVLKKAVDLDSFHINALKLLATVHRRLSSSENALEISLDAIKLDPNDSEALEIKGNALYEMKKLQKALEAYEKSTKMNPEYFNAWYSKGHLMLYQLKHYKKAQEAFERAVNIHPNDERAKCGIGAALINQGQNRNALHHLEKSFKENPTYPFFLYYKGVALYNLKRYEEALDAFEDTIRNYPEDDIELLLYKAETLEKLGFYNLAKKTYEKAIQVEKGKAIPYVYMGDMYFANGDIPHALENANKALNLEKNADALLLKGLIKIEQKEYDGAIDTIIEANSLKLGDSKFYLWSAYAKYVKLESLVCAESEKIQTNQETNSKNKTEKPLRYETHMEEIFEITRDLEKASKLAKKVDDHEGRACILYFLGYFYYKCNDIFTAKEKLKDCIEIHDTNVRPRAKELLGFIWNREIQPSWWNWWLSSPIQTKRRQILFCIIALFIILFTIQLLVPQMIPSPTELILGDTGHSEQLQTENVHIEIEKQYQNDDKIIEKLQINKKIQYKTDGSEEVNRLPFAGVIIGLVIILLLPNLQNIKAKDIDMQLRSPPSIDLFLSPTAIEVEIEKTGLKLSQD